VPYWTTKECEAETNKRISIDSGEAYMSICSCCFKRFIKRSMEKKWYGWFDCDYPPEAEVVGSKWFYENVKHVKLIKATPTVVAVNTFDPEPLPLTVASAKEPEASAKEPEPVPVPVPVPEPEAVPEVKEAEAEPEAALEQQMAKMTIQDNKEALRQRIKEIQARAKPVEQETKLIIKDKKEALKQRIKEIQARAKPGKMPMKEIQTAFKEITDLKTQIHML